MLLSRSIFLQVCLLLTTRCYCQDYESYDSEDAPEESGPEDYSKYYAVDTSAPLVSAQGNPSQIGFTSPIEYAGFFDPSIDFGATIKQEVAHPKNPFAAQTKSLGFIASQAQFPDFSSSAHFPIDYFEEAQKTQTQENQEDDGFLPSGPTYISHNLPVNLDADYSSGVERVQPKPKKNKKKVHHYDVEKEAAAEYEYQPSSPSGKYADYNTGKSGSTVSQQYEAPTPTPYQKYSFQPVEEGGQSKYLSDLISTVAPFNPAYTKVASTATPAFETQSSENVPSHLKGKNCRRVRKHIPEEHGREKREAMNCFVCENPESSSKYTQCSYAVEPEPQNDYSGVSERFSTPPKDPTGFRYKRYSGDDNVDPYEYIRARSQKEYEKEYEEYKVPEFYTADDGLDKSFSEIQSEAVSKNPANCHKEESNGMTCTICKDPKSGGNYEQCSYTSEPKEKKYAYVTEKKYDSDEPEHGSETKPAVQTTEIESSIKSIPDNKNDHHEKEHEPSPSTDQKNAVKLDEPTLPSIDISKYEKLENFGDDSKDFKPTSTNDDAQYKKFENFKPAELYKTNYQGHDKFKLSDKYNPDSTEDPVKEPYKPEEGFEGAQSNPKKLINDDPYDIPKHFAESTIKEQKAVRRIEPSYYGSAESAESEDADSSNLPYKDIDEYHFKLFPEFSHEESQQAKVVTKPSADTTRKDVEEVLAEFSKKDRSACKKAQKNGMTCYLCVDAKGIQHEECMYVSESKPQASHVAYHEVKQLKSPEAKEQTSAGTEAQAVTSAPVVLEAAASEEHPSRVKYNPKRNSKKAKKVREQERAATRHIPEKDETFDDEPKKETPSEFVVGAEEGAFSAETKPVYSKTLGVKLPRYMIEKSEFEKEFDEFAEHH